MDYLRFNEPFSANVWQPLCYARISADQEHLLLLTMCHKMDLIWIVIKATMFCLSWKIQRSLNWLILNSIVSIVFVKLFNPMVCYCINAFMFNFVQFTHEIFCIIVQFWQRLMNKWFDIVITLYDSVICHGPCTNIDRKPCRLIAFEIDVKQQFITFN